MLAPPPLRSPLALPFALSGSWCWGVAVIVGLACAPTPVPAEAPQSPAPAGLGAEDPSAQGADAPNVLAAALAGEHRSAENRARDDQRHPLETLTFFGVEPTMTVVELWPGGGWYTEILAAVTHGQGRLITTNFDVNASDDPEDYRVRVGRAFAEKIAGDPIYAGVTLVTVRDPKELVLADPGTVDLVVTFRNSHNWIADGTAAPIYAAAFAALRPGGSLGVVQHRARADDPRDPVTLAKTGYVREDALIASVEAQGFRLAERSEINANPADTKDYPEGVWGLPPRLRIEGDDEAERTRRQGIGESDRMTLRFVKPE